MERNADGRELRPTVGIGVYIFNNNGEVLLGKRKGAHGKSEYATPGGHLEYGETFEEACQREAREESGLEISDLELFNVDNNLKYLKSDNKHFVTLSFKCRSLGGEPKALELEKCEGWGWYSLQGLPRPLTEYCENSLSKLITGAFLEGHPPS